jgi:hypothetical protein
MIAADHAEREGFGKLFQRKGLPRSDGQPVVAVKRRRHNWWHANPAACRDNTRPVFGSADSAGGRAFGCSKTQGRTGQPGFAAAPFLAQGSGRSIEAVG